MSGGGGYATPSRENPSARLSGGLSPSRRQADPGNGRDRPIQRGHHMTTNIPRAFTDRANVPPLTPENTSSPAHSAPAVSRRSIMRSAAALMSMTAVAAPSIAAAAFDA